MDLDDVIEELQSLREIYGGDTEVRLAMQPQWSFEYSIGGIVVNDPEEQIDADDDQDCEDDEERPVVFIGEGSQLGYLSGRAHNLLKANGVW